MRVAHHHGGVGAKPAKSLKNLEKPKKAYFGALFELHLVQFKALAQLIQAQAAIKVIALVGFNLAQFGLTWPSLA